GQVVATVKDPTLTGFRLFVVQGLTEHMQPKGKPFVAVDGIACAGMGDVVTMTFKRDAAIALGNKTPIDACIIGFVDESTVLEKDGSINTFKP
ncbi:EutN/CcmL family microcompartment protein, partial [Myxococcota bacterium]|nr:EutN/CcmL family microcompartment protein [Myxococcota bacterium]